MSRARTQNNTFVRQAAILAFAGLLTRFLGFLYRLPLTNMIGDIGNGIYSTGYYIYTFFLILSSAGLPAAISKMVSERTALGQHKNAKRVLRISLIFSSIFGALCSFALYFGAGALSAATKSEESYMAIIMLAPTIFIVAVMAVFRGYFQGLNNTVPTAVSQIVEQIFNASFSLILAHFFMESAAGTGAEIAMGAAGGTAGTGIGALFGLAVILWIYFAANPTISKKIRRDKSGFTETDSNIFRELLRTAFPIIAGTAIFSFSNLIDMFMVNTCLDSAGVFTKDEITALYGQLTGKYVVLTTLPVSISTSLATASIPSISASFKLGEKKAAKRKIASAIRIAMLLSIPCAVGIGVLGNPILRLLYPRYSEGSVLLAIGSVSIVFLSLAQILTGVLQAAGMVNVPVLGALLGVLIKIPVNYVLISNPDINVAGAVIGTTCCYAAAGLFNWYMLIKFTRMKPDILGVILKPLAASAAMGVACYSAYYICAYILDSNAISTFFAIAVGIAVYLFFIILLQGIKKEDLRGIPFASKLSGFILQ